MSPHFPMALGGGLNLQLTGADTGSEVSPLPQGMPCTAARLASVRGLKSQEGLVHSHPCDVSSTVPRILLAWLPVAPQCPQDSGSRPGHRGTRRVLQNQNPPLHLCPQCPR